MYLESDYLHIFFLLFWAGFAKCKILNDPYYIKNVSPCNPPLDTTAIF